MSVVLVTVKDGGRPGGGGTQLLGFEKKIKAKDREFKATLGF